VENLPLQANLASYFFENLRQATLDEAAINGQCLLNGVARWFAENVGHSALDRGFSAGSASNSCKLSDIFSTSRAPTAQLSDIGPKIIPSVALPRRSCRVVRPAAFLRRHANVGHFLQKKSTELPKNIITDGIDRDAAA